MFFLYALMRLLLQTFIKLILVATGVFFRSFVFLPFFIFVYVITWFNFALLLILFVLSFDDRDDHPAQRGRCYSVT